MESGTRWLGAGSGAAGIPGGWTDAGRRPRVRAARWPILAGSGPEVIMQEISAAIHGFLLREFLPGEDPAELTDRTPLISGGILDSIGTLKLVAFLEDRFGVTIAAHEAGIDRLDAVADIAQLVARKRGALRVGS